MTTESNCFYCRLYPDEVLVPGLPDLEPSFSTQPPDVMKLVEETLPWRKILVTNGLYFLDEWHLVNTKQVDDNDLGHHWWGMICWCKPVILGQNPLDGTTWFLHRSLDAGQFSEPPRSGYLSRAQTGSDSG